MGQSGRGMSASQPRGVETELRRAGSKPAPIEIILVALDGSHFSERALLAAVPLAERLGARLFLFSAVANEDEANDRLGRLSDLRPRGIPAEIDVLPDPDPADAIDTLLRDLGNAVACIASHGRGRTAAVLGSVANEVVRRRRQPTIVVGPAFSRERVGRGVVACVDETPPSARVLPFALRWSELLDETLTVIAVAEPVPPPISPGAVPHRRFGPDTEVEPYLERLVAPLREEGHEIHTKAVYDPVSPASGLRHYLWDCPSSLVAVGSHLRRGLPRSVLGSVAASVVRQSSVPVLLGPRPDVE
jgi:nucleotide-binding universal stress UspA family protein